MKTMIQHDNTDIHPNSDLLIELAQKKSWYQVRQWRPIWISAIQSPTVFTSPNGDQVNALSGQFVCRTWNLYYSQVDPDYLDLSYYPTRSETNGWHKYLPRQNRAYWAAQVFHDFVFVNIDGVDQFGKKGDFLVMDNDEDLFLIPKRYFHKEYQKILTSSDIQAISVVFGMSTKGLDMKNPKRQNSPNDMPNLQNTTLQMKESFNSGTDEPKDSGKTNDNGSGTNVIAPRIIEGNEEDISVGISDMDVDEDQEDSSIAPTPGIIGGYTPQHTKIPQRAPDEETNVPIHELYSRSRLRSSAKKHEKQKPKTETDHVPEFLKLKRRITGDKYE